MIPLLLGHPATADNLRSADKLVVLVLGCGRDDRGGELLVAFDAIGQLMPAIFSHTAVVVMPN